MRWVRAEPDTPALAREVAALRCGLDGDAWAGAGKDRCANAVGAAVPGATPTLPPPFDYARAHSLYMGLLGQVRDLIKGKQLLIVPSGAMTQLRFHVLVTEPPSPGGGKDKAGTMGPDPQGAAPVAWLVRAHAITILPAVSSLGALRRVGKVSTAAKPLIGFGNPLLDGPDARYEGWAELARDAQRCPVVARQAPQEVAALADLRGAVARVPKRSGLVDVVAIKAQIPLPETA